MSSEQLLRNQRNIRALSDVGLGEVRRPPPLFHDLMLQRSLIMVSAEPFTGKTMLTLAMSLCLDSGLPLLGAFEPYEKRRFLYIGQDAPTWDYAEQTRKLLRGLDLSPDQVDLLDTEAMFNEGVDILDREFISFIHAWHNEMGLDGIIFDTLASIHSADENSSREMGVVMTALKRLRDRLGLTIVFTHHDAKPSGDSERSAIYRPRGSSVIAGSVDAHISLRTTKTGSIHFTTPKGRGLANTKRKLLYDMVDTGTSSDPGLKLVAQTEGSTHQAIILQALKDGMTTRADFATALQVKAALTAATSSTATDNALRSLERRALVQRKGRGIWSLT
jgi:hypothetical protein